MSGGEEQIECPLCMEPLEMDDISFFPCTCGYQICRFCWHRIRTYENGLCPACRKLYPENPAEFKPLSDDELQNIKKERRQKDVQRKQKAAENRKHLANVRVVQKNLVFVVGLSPRLADPEVLKRHEYFGKFGKIHKVVINQSTTYAGSQSNGPSAGAYVTYIRAEDALRALQNVNNVFVDGRTLKASLGTTKYCSHFLKGTQCPKQDCMYLHELGEEAASFTKDEMQQGKHQEYEQKLYELFMNSQNTTNPVTKTTNSSTVPNQTNRKKNASPPAVVPQAPQHHNPTSYNSGTAALHQITNKTDTRLTNGNGNKPHSPPSPTSSDGDMTPTPTDNPEKAPGANLNRHNNRPPAPPSQYTIQPDKNANSTITDQQLSNSLPKSELLPLSSQSPPTQVPSTHSPPLVGQIPPNIGASTKKAIFDANPENSLSLFSGSGFPLMRSAKPVQPPVPPQVPPRDPITSTEIPDHIPVSSSTDWQAAFGFKSSNSEHHDDDLGFDPWDESAKGLADLIEREQGGHQNHINHYPHMGFQPHSIPPGFTPSHINPYLQKSELELLGHSKILGLVSSPSRPPGFAHKQQQQQPNPYTNVISDSSGIDPPHNEDIFTKNWQEGLKALFPNVNISFGAPQFASTSANRPISQQQHHQHHQHPQHAKSWPSQSQCNNTYSTGDWMAQDPAIVTSGSISDAQSLSSVEDQPPHWMKSLQQLTEIDTNPNHRLPFVQNFPFNGRRWSQNPPPGFQSQIRPNTQITEPHTLAEGLQ